jgi:enterochelin esterase family protein
MTNDEIRRNAETRMTKTPVAVLGALRHSSFGFLSSFVLLAISLLAFFATGRAQNLAGDEALSKVLIDGEGWQLVAEGFGFTDAACADAQGNFYFFDLGKGTNGIQRIGPDGKAATFIAKTPKCSGLKFGPDGRFYACTQGTNKQVVALEVPSGKVTVLADDVQPNDLIVSRKGLVYFTETGKGQVSIVDPKGNARVGATGINKPNGITLAPDHGTLAVSEYGGTNVWVFRVEKDGSLTAGERYMTLRAPSGKTDSGGDGMTTDAQGRYYVTSHLGIQMFDSTGRLGGVIERPQNKGTVSVAFAGPNLEYLYVCSSDKIYRRKTQTKGVLP